MDYKKEFEDKINGFIEHHKFKFIDFSDNELIIEAPIEDIGLNPYDMVHGGLLFGLMDTCAGLHVFLQTKREAVTISSNINYVKACKGSKIVAKSKPIKIGKNISIVEVYAYNDKGELVTTGSFNFYYIN